MHRDSLGNSSNVYSRSLLLSVACTLRSTKPVSSDSGSKLISLVAFGLQHSVCPLARLSGVLPPSINCNESDTYSYKQCPLCVQRGVYTSYLSYSFPNRPSSCMYCKYTEYSDSCEPIGSSSSSVVPGTKGCPIFCKAQSCDPQPHMFSASAQLDSQHFSAVVPNNSSSPTCMRPVHEQEVDFPQPPLDPALSPMWSQDDLSGFNNVQGAAMSDIASSLTGTHCSACYPVSHSVSATFNNSLPSCQNIISNNLALSSAVGVWCTRCESFCCEHQPEYNSSTCKYFYPSATIHSDIVPPFAIADYSTFFTMASSFNCLAINPQPQNKSRMLIRLSWKNWALKQ